MNPLALAIITWCLVFIVALLALLVSIGLIALIVIVITACLSAVREMWQGSKKEKK